MSTKNPTQGQKVKDPNAPNIEEAAGAVAADSLAAESTREGGEFSENRNSEPLGVKGGNSTFANENTSGAITLPAAKDREARSAAQKDQQSHSGTTSEEGFTERRVTKSGNGEREDDVDQASSYVNSQFVDHSKPKGKNITEDDQLRGKNASFNGEIGTKNDPGRLAEEKFTNINADTGGLAGFPSQKGSSGENDFEILKNTEA